MTQPNKSDSQLADRNDNPQIAARGASVTAVAAATAVNPSAPTNYDAHASGAVAVTSNAATDLDTTAAALDTLEDEVTIQEIAISALIVDVDLMRTAINDLVERLEAHGLIADN